MSVAVALASSAPSEDVCRRRVAATLLRAASDLLAAGHVNITAATVALEAARNELERLGYIQDGREVARAKHALRAGLKSDCGAVLVIIGTAMTLTKAEYLAEHGRLQKSK